MATGQLVDFRELRPIELLPQAEASLFQIWPLSGRPIPWLRFRSLSHKTLLDLSKMWAKANEDGHSLFAYSPHFNRDSHVELIHLVSV